MSEIERHDAGSRQEGLGPAGGLQDSIRGRAGRTIRWRCLCAAVPQEPPVSLASPQGTLPVI